MFAMPKFGHERQMRYNISKAKRTAGKEYVLMSDKQYLITDAPGRALLRFSLPMIIGSFFQQTYTMIDSMVVGRYVSESALAAVGACYAFTNIFIWSAQGGGIGASVVVSRLFGGQDYRKMTTAVRTALTMFLLISLGLMAVGLFISRPVMVLLRTPAESLDASLIYLNIYFLGLPFLFLYNIVSSMFNALGNSRIPLYFLIFSSVLNIFLDIWFVRSFHMGIAGVAWATLLAQGISAAASLMVLRSDLRKYKTGRGLPIFDRDLAGQMWAVAWPSTLQQSTVSIGMMVVQSVVNTFGAAALAGYSAGMRIENYCCVPWTAFNSAISTYTAQNIGAGKNERIRAGFCSTCRMILVCSILLFVILEAAADPLMKAFLGSNLSAEAARVGAEYIRWDGICVGLLGLKMAIDGTLRGAADTKAFTIANLVNLGIRVALSFILAPVFGIRMVWIASPIGWTANALISGLHLRKRPWFRRSDAGSRRN